jgi:Tfp pilus assembly ATPase PilU
MIKDPGRVVELPDYIRESREEHGMQTFDQHLIDLVSEGIVASETALAASSNPADFELRLRTLHRRPRVAAATETAGVDAEKAAGLTDDLSSMLPEQ